MNAVDTHCHVFTDPAVPTTPVVGGAAYAPPAVDVEDHARMLAEAGCERGVLVQPSAYGQDHRCLRAALAARPDHLRGVACVDADTDPEELAELHALGVRATRLQDGYPGGVPVAELVRVGEAIAPLGWHLEVWTDLRRHVDTLARDVRDCPVPVVIDHLGYLPSDVGHDDPAMLMLLELLADDQVWVTLSGLERLVPAGVEPGRSGYAAAWDRHAAAIAERVALLAAVRPENLLWGSDWPHVGLTLPLPHPAEVRARAEEWLPDPETRRLVLQDNPARRYAFGPAAGPGPPEVPQETP